MTLGMRLDGAACPQCRAWAIATAQSLSHLICASDKQVIFDKASGRRQIEGYMLLARSISMPKWDNGMPDREGAEWLGAEAKGL